MRNKRFIWSVDEDGDNGGNSGSDTLGDTGDSAGGETRTDPPTDPPPPPPPPADNSDIRETVGRLTESVAALTDLVTGLVHGNDKTPVSVPWTHKFGKTRDQ